MKLIDVHVNGGSLCFLYFISNVIDLCGFSLFYCGSVGGLLHLERVKPRSGLTFSSVRRHMFVDVFDFMAVV